VARLGTRLPEIAHIFAIEPEESAGRTPRAPARRGASRAKKARTEPQPAADADGGAATGSTRDSEPDGASTPQGASAH
jgi:hypothetical protein